MAGRRKADYWRDQIGALVLAIIIGIGSWALTRLSAVDSLEGRIAALESLCGHR